MARKLTYEEVKDFIEIESNSGCTLLSDKYLGSQTKLLFQCRCKREFKTTYNRFKFGQKRHCNVCGGKEVDREYISNFVKTNSTSILVSGDCRSTTSDLEFLCDCGKMFNTSFNQFKQQGKRQCNECGYIKGVQSKKLKYKDIKNYIDGLDGNGCTLISKKYQNNYTKIKILCACGSVFFTTYQSFTSASKKQCDKCGISNETTTKYESIKSQIEEDISNWMTLTLADEYVEGVNTYLTVIDDEGYKYWTTLRNLKTRYENNGVLQKFNPYNKYSLENIKTWMLLNNTLCKLEDGNEYISSRHKLNFICEHGKKMSMSWGNFQSGKRCRCVSWAPRKDPETFISEVDDLVGDEYTILTKYITTIIPIRIRHNPCSHEYSVTPSSFLSGRRCPLCSMSKGEQRVKEKLVNESLNYESEYSFDDLVGLGGQPLRFDFAVFDDCAKLKVLIEYDGEFHFKEYYESQNFETLKIHDKRKNEFCRDNNIQLIRIPYWQFDKIEQILDKWLNKCDSKKQ